MSTKSLKRTVIEGGRTGSSKWERHFANTIDRARAKEFCKKVALDPELAEELEIEKQGNVWQDFSDKLSPMYRWLESQVGRSWSEVRSEVFQKFDTRTTAGRHITFDHLLKEVVDTESGFDRYGRMSNPNIPIEHSGRERYSYADYYVDENGILCKGFDRRKNRNAWRYTSVSEKEYVEAANWLQNRMISEKDDKLYWHHPTEGIWMASWINPHGYYRPYSYGRQKNTSLTYYHRQSGPYEVHSPIKGSYGYFDDFKYKQHGDHWEAIENPFSFRQRRELTEEEISQFRSFKERIQKDILVFGKGR